MCTETREHIISSLRVLKAGEWHSWPGLVSLSYPWTLLLETLWISVTLWIHC